MHQSGHADTVYKRARAGNDLRTKRIPSYCIGSIAAAFLLAGSSPASADAIGDKLSAMTSFDLPAQPLGTALKQLANQANIQILFEERVVAGLLAPALKAHESTAEALDVLLSHTDLEYTASGQTIAVRRKRISAATTSLNSRAVSEGPLRLAQSPSSSDLSGSSDTKSFPTAETGNAERLPLEEVVVAAGSRLQQSAEQSAVPVNVYSRERIDQSGASTLGQFLNTLPEVSTQTTSDSQRNGGATTVQLRGLPVGTTLILINGRRVEGTTGLQASQGAFFDLKSIPLSAIERLEVLPSGSSAIYGGDALRGVLNVVLKKNYTGLEADLRYGGTDGDYHERELSLSGGWQATNWSLSAVAVVADNSELEGSDRALTANADYTKYGGLDYRSTYTNPGNVCSASGTNLSGLGSPCAGIPNGSSGVGLTPANFLPTAGILNEASESEPNSSLLAPSHRYGIFIQGSYRFNSSAELFTELLYNGSRVTQFLAPPAATVDVAAANPFNPFGQDVTVQYRFTGLGRESYIADQDFVRPLIGIRGSIEGRWHWEVAAWSSLDWEKTFDNWYTAQQSTIDAAAADGTFNPFQDGSGAPPAVLNTFFAPNVSRTHGAMESANAYISGPVIQLPSGTVEAVIGAEYQHDSLKWAFPTVASENFDLTRESKAGFAELQVPIVARPNAAGAPILATQLAARYDRYSDFGSRASYQGGLEFRPLTSLLVRASYGSAFKPPQLYDAGSPSDAFAGVEVHDPKRGGQDTLINLIYGGNPNLSAETGWSRNLGFVWAPEGAQGLNVSLTQWTIHIEKGFTLPTQDQFLAYEDQLPGHVTRAPVAAGDPYGVGVVTTINDDTINFGYIKESGLDALINCKLHSPIGEFSPSVAVTETYSYRFELSPGFPEQNAVSRANDNGSYAPRWKAVVALNWQRNGAQLGADGRYTGRYQDVIDLTPTPRELGNFWYVDLNGRYELGNQLFAGKRWLSKTFIAAGVRNLLNKQPEYSDHQYGYYGYDPTQYDIQGRFTWFQIGIRL